MQGNPPTTYKQQCVCHIMTVNKLGKVIYVTSSMLVDSWVDYEMKGSIAERSV